VFTDDSFQGLKAYLKATGEGNADRYPFEPLAWVREYRGEPDPPEVILKLVSELKRVREFLRVRYPMEVETGFVNQLTYATWWLGSRTLKRDLTEAQGCQIYAWVMQDPPLAATAPLQAPGASAGFAVPGGQSLPMSDSWYSGFQVPHPQTYGPQTGAGAIVPFLSPYEGMLAPPVPFLLPLGANPCTIGTEVLLHPHQACNDLL
jgi:hypothetical protein